MLKSEELGNIRSDPAQAEKVEVKVDREDFSHNGFYLVTGFSYNQHGGITEVKPPTLESSPETGVFNSVEVTYSDGAEAGTIGLGRIPKPG